MDRLTFALAVPWLLLAACGFEGTPAVSFDAGEPRDVFVVPRDIGTTDALPGADAAADALPAADAAVPPCTSWEITLAEEPVERTDRVALAAGADRFAVAWIGVPPLERHAQANWAIVSAGETMAPAARFTTLMGNAAGPSLLAVGGQFLLAFYSNASVPPDFEIYSQRIDADGNPVGAPTQRTMRTGRDDQVQLGLAGSMVLATWLEGTTDMRRAVIQPWATDGSSAGAVVELVPPPAPPLSLAITAHDTGAIAAYARTASTGTGTVIALQRLSTTGAAIGGAVEVSSERNAEGSVDLAVRGSNEGAVLFGVAAGTSPQIRGQLFDSTGAAMGSERVISPAAANAVSPSVSRYGAGYVAAYRVRLAGEWRLEVAFISGVLAVEGRVDVGPVTESGPVSVRVTKDGRIGVARIDARAGSTRVLFTQLTCN